MPPKGGLSPLWVLLPAVTSSLLPQVNQEGIASLAQVMLLRLYFPERWDVSFPQQPLTEECFQSHQTPDKVVEVDDELVVGKASDDDLMELAGQLEAWRGMTSWWLGSQAAAGLRQNRPPDPRPPAPSQGPRVALSETALILQS